MPVSRNRARCHLLCPGRWYVVGGNIGGLYPVFQTALTGRSLQDWIADRVKQSEVKTSELELQMGDGVSPDGALLADNNMPRTRELPPKLPDPRRGNPELAGHLCGGEPQR